MGNLLGSPITEKETHTGETSGNEKLKYGLSSMQGWRVHMEDAHIAEVNLYALDTTNSTKKENNSTQIKLNGHSLFACYDGHGGTFAAIYSGNNFLRILSKQSKFVEYAKLCESSSSSTSSSSTTTTRTTTTSSDTTTKNNTIKNERVIKLDLLEKALKQAFVETDYEIALAIRGKPHIDANTFYHDSTKKIVNAPIDDESGDSGTTACVVMITPDSIVCANAGDSRAVFARRVVDTDTTDTTDTNDASSSNDAASNSNANSNAASTNNKAIPLSFDHKPDDEEETRRIRNAGGYVAGGRVEGDLAVSRGLGDFRFKQMPIVLNNTQLFPTNSDSIETGSGGGTDTIMTTDDDDSDNNNSDEYGGGRKQRSPNPNPNPNPSSTIIFPPGKQKVSPIPDVIVHTRQPLKDEYIIVACDGIWDVVSNIQCIHEIDTIMYNDGEKDLGLISEEILDLCLQFGSKDNMTAIIIQLPACEKGYIDGKTKAMISKSKQEGVLGRRRERKVEGDDHTNANANANGSNPTDGGSNIYADAFNNANIANAADNDNDNDVDDDDVDVDPKYM
jgi:serine/threonine protein phosphatase PrpC